MDIIWYETLNKPNLTPPSWVFTPAWIFLYILILFSIITYAFTKTAKNKTAGYVFFGIQMILNLLWTPAFFHFQNIRLSLVIICLLMIFIILTIIAFYKVSKIAAALLVPYIIWVGFAIYLNYGIMILNTL